jgi:hypothetical protein
MRTEYSHPAVYRWAVYLRDGRIQWQYVGETEKLYKRLQAYLKPCHGTEQRVKQELDKARQQGLSVRIEVLEFEPFEINGFEFEPRLLSDPFARKAVENLVALFAEEAGCRISNRGQDLVVKILAPLHKFDRLRPTVIVRELKRLRSTKPSGERSVI